MRKEFGDTADIGFNPEQGPGAFMLKEYIPASRAVFETNLDYFEKGKKFVQEIMAILDKDQPLVPLCIRYQHYVTQPYLEGWENFGDGNGHFGFADIVNAWLNK